MTATDFGRPIEILLVDDDDDDVFLMKIHMERDHIANRISRVQDGVEAMQYLRQQAPFEDAVRPDLIFLDLNMPRKDGREVLREIKADKNLCTIPVIVLTTSDQNSDIVESYERHASSYVTKPVDLLQFRHVLKSLGGYWFSVVKFPGGTPLEKFAEPTACTSGGADA